MQALSVLGIVLEIKTEPYESKQDVCVQGALVGLVNHHDRVGRQVRLPKQLPKAHTVRHVSAKRLANSAYAKQHKRASFT